MAWECCHVPEGVNPSGAHPACLPADCGKGGRSTNGIEVNLLERRVCFFFLKATFMLVSN